MQFIYFLILRLSADQFNRSYIRIYYHMLLTIYDEQ